MRHVVALSGGKDSTALALRLAEVEPRDYLYFCTPTGNELPPLVEHWLRLETLLGKPITYVTNGTLGSWIEHFGALPNNRQRWCTRLLKIEPCIAFMQRLAAEDGEKPILYVGLRADEPTRVGIYGGEVVSRYPMQEWGWGEASVWTYLRSRGVTVPPRTDCADCYDQQLIEWWFLWRDFPASYAEGEAWEAKTGHSFRCPSRDTWPASLVELRKEFERGRVPREGRQRRQGALDLGEYEEGACRVCSL